MADDKIDVLTKEMREMRHEFRQELREMRHEFRQELRDAKEGLRTEIRTEVRRVEKKVDGIASLLVATEKASERLNDRVTRLERRNKNS